MKRGSKRKNFRYSEYQWRVVIGISLIGLILRWRVPAFIIPSTPKDDLLGVRLTSSLTQGNWLGTWSQDTLVKPPGYPIFLSFCHWFDLNPILVTYVIYLIFSAFFVHSLSSQLNLNISRAKYFTTFTTLFSTFNPLLYSNDFSRVYRTSLDCLLVFVSLTVLLKIVVELSELSSVRPNFRILQLRYFIILLTLFSCIMGISKVNRTESDWLFLSALLFVIVILIQKFKKIIGINRFTGCVVLIFIVAFLAFQTPMTILKMINHKVYGSYSGENFYSGNYAKALNLWSAVDDGSKMRPGVAIDASQRAIVYKISPTARKLQKYLELPPNTGYRVYNCQASGICDESGSWFPWEVRDAAITAGSIENETEFQEFFGLIALDIEESCESRKIKCKAPGYAPGTRDLKSYLNQGTIQKSLGIFIRYPGMIGGKTFQRGDNGHDQSDLSVWHSVVRFYYPVPFVQTSLDKFVINFLGVLKHFYMLFFTILLSFIILERIFRLRNWHIIDMFTAFLGFASFTFTFGIATFETSLGFTPDLEFYTLPGQSIITCLALVGIFKAFQINIFSKFKSVSFHQGKNHNVLKKDQ